VAPVDADFVSGFDVDDFVGGRSTRVASDIAVIDIGDGVVGRSDADTVALAQVLAIDTDALSDSMR